MYLTRTTFKKKIIIHNKVTYNFWIYFKVKIDCINYLTIKCNFILKMYYTNKI